MKRKNSIISLICIIVCMVFSNVSMAATWYSDGYSWARSNGIIGGKTHNQLMSYVSAKEFYTMFFKYLDYVGASSINQTYVKIDDYKSDNYILVSVDRQLTQLAKKDWITNDEYKRAVALIENARNILNTNAEYFTTQESDSIHYYLDIMNYILYTKIYDYEYRLQVYCKKPSGVDKFEKYKLIPYYGQITREEFLNLLYMYRVKQSNNFSTTDCVTYFMRNGVLLGYDNNPMLSMKLTNAHLVTFIYRMEQQ